MHCNISGRKLCPEDSIVSRYMSYSDYRSVCGYCRLLAWNGLANAMICVRTQLSRYFWTLGMALGIMFTFLSPGFAPDLSAYLFGNILTITFGDIALLAGLAVILAIFFILYLRPIIYVAFDREFARSQGIPVQIFEYVLMMFIALTIVACLRMVGIVLVISLLTIPQMTANLFTHRFHRIIWLSIGIGYLSCLGGLMISYYLNVPSGAAIIFFSIIIYVVCKLGKSFYLSLRQKTQNP